MAPTTIKVTVEQVTRLFRSERMPGAGEVRLVEIPPWDEFTIESEDWTARGYVSRIFVEGLIEHPPLVCLSVKRWDDEEWTGMAMTPDEARSLAAHLLALAGPDPEEQVEGPEGKVEAGPDPEASDPVAVGINVHDLERPAASTPVARGRVTVTSDGLSVDFTDVPKGNAERIAAAFNKYADDRRYYKVVQMGYKLAPGFEP